MVDTKQARCKYHVAQNFCSCFFLGGLGIFSVSRKLILRLGVMKQECSVIVRWRDFVLLLLNFVIKSFPRLSDSTDCGVKHSKYSIKLTT